MTTVRPFKFEKTAVGCGCTLSAPVVASGDDKGLNIAQLADKYTTLLYGEDLGSVDKLQGLIGKLDTFESAQPHTIDDHFEIKLHGINKCALIQTTAGQLVVTDNTGREHHIAEGDTLLIPAATTLVEVDGHGGIILAQL